MKATKLHAVTVSQAAHGIFPAVRLTKHYASSKDAAMYGAVKLYDPFTGRLAVPLDWAARYCY